LDGGATTAVGRLACLPTDEVTVRRDEVETPHRYRMLAASLSKKVWTRLLTAYPGPRREAR